jgi:hypothetical protein
MWHRLHEAMKASEPQEKSPAIVLQKNNEEIGVSIFPLATVNTFLPK